ncbi:hypothetical protein VNI00_012177 [Paramarasmius palmivorus]|uniref:RRM domain-containing protein n=1 Tax=Paramarasmius palmivorus TaxID=297713 RepID=A0AAW0C7I6_9AGAR
MLKLQHLMDLNTHIRAMLEYLSGSLQSPPTIPGDQSLPKPSHAVDEKFGEVANSYLSDASPSSSFGVASHVGDATDAFQNPCNRGLKDYELDVKRIEDGLDKRTTVMVKNIPNKVTGKELQIFIDEACGRRIDFMYLRIDYRTRANYGYAFVNFLTCQDLLRFVRAKMNRKWNLHSSEKVVQVNYARLQGKKALIRHFYDSNVLDEREEWRPKLFYSDGLHQGLPEPFPSLRNVTKSQSSAFAENAQELRREANRVERSRNKRARLA